MDDCSCNTNADFANYPGVLPTPHQARLGAVSEMVAQTPIPARIRLKINTKAKLPEHIERLGLKAKTLEGIRKMLGDPAMTRRFIEQPDIVFAELALKLEDPALAAVPGARKPAPLSSAVQLTIVKGGRS
jgi:hypothetical protein